MNEMDDPLDMEDYNQNEEDQDVIFTQATAQNAIANQNNMNDHDLKDEEENDMDFDN
jgi:hypothetical protein